MTTDLLTANGLSVSYSGTRVLWDVSIRVGRGEIVALMGPNGSGKSTLMNAVSRLLPLDAGEIVLDGRPTHGLRAHHMLGMGMSHVLERHRLFPYMTVLENLQLGAGPRAQRAVVDAGLDRAYALFPRLKERQRQLAHSMSGGEQQMCAIARGLMSDPRLLLVDEPFIGLSPAMRHEVAAAITRVNAGGVAILLIEQNVAEALRLGHRAYVLREGRVALEDDCAVLRGSTRVQDVFLGRLREAAA
jgi:branched-chain amino acid transport system ATP-binding protein